MPSKPPAAPSQRPKLPRLLVEQVVEKAIALGEDVADQDPAIIIKTILRRYVEGEPLAPSQRKSARPPASSPVEPAAPDPPRVSRPTPVVDGAEPRALFREKVYNALADTVQPDGLTKPIGNKNLAKLTGASATFIRTLIGELLSTGRLVEVEPCVGTRGPRYRIK
jgi:hypothetical protein